MTTTPTVIKASEAIALYERLMLSSPFEPLDEVRRAKALADAVIAGYQRLLSALDKDREQASAGTVQDQSRGWLLVVPICPPESSDAGPQGKQG